MDNPRMRSYGQYCPISRASEILAERWTPLVVRNLLLGCTTFNDLARGVPGMSRSLLAQRLRMLEDAGVVRTRPKAERRGRAYELTDAGRDLWNVIRPLAAWGQRWVELQPEHTDPSFVLWAWVHVHLRRERLPQGRVVVEFEFPEQPTGFRRFWMLVEGGDAELCYSHPGFDPDLQVTARSVPFTRWHVGEIEWRDALRRGDIRIDGSRALARALPTWNERALPRPGPDVARDESGPATKSGGRSGQSSDARRSKTKLAAGLAAAEGQSPKPVPTRRAAATKG